VPSKYTPSEDEPLGNQTLKIVALPALAIWAIVGLHRLVAAIPQTFEMCFTLIDYAKELL
jgi:hypothetical protein